MNKWQKGVLGNRVEEDEKILKRLKKMYAEAEKSIDEKIEALLARTDTENLQSIIYQVDYQKALKSQIRGILDELNANQFNDISDYLKQSYENGFIGTMYDLQGQGIPLVFPIDQEQVVRVLKNNSKLSKGLWGSLYDRNSALQNNLRAELSRGISQGYSYSQIAKNVSDKLGVSYNNTARIVRTESHRIANEAAMDAQYKAKEAGADIVKQWDATLDGATRPAHRELDGQIRELDEPFEAGGMTAMYPGGFGSASQDVNCRCAILQRARWALDEEELERLKERAEYFGLNKDDSFADYKKKYLGVIESPEFKNPYIGKKISLTPEGNFYEDELFGGDVYEIDWDGTIPEGAELIMDMSTGEMIPKSALKKVKEGTQFDKEVWSINPDGTYSMGKVKDQAEFKIDIKNNEVFQIDISDAIDKDIATMFETSGPIAQYDAIYAALPDNIRDLFDAEYDIVGEPGLALQAALKKNGYKGYSVYNHGTYQDLVDDYFKVFDESLITKTKKSKFETLTDDLAKAQKKLNKIDNKTYSGIWKEDVSVSDYAAKKASIQAKKDYFEMQIKDLEELVDDGLAASYDKVMLQQYKKYLADLDEFEELGKKYEAAAKKVSKIQADINKIKPKTDVTAVGSSFDADVYTSECKNMAHWYTNANGGSRAADAAYRDKCGEVWRGASQLEKDSTYEYTRSYHKFNEPLRGIEYGTNKYLGPGNVDLDTIGINYGGYKKGEVRKQIDAMTNLIDRSSYDFDVWTQRGCRYNGMDKFFGIDPSDFYLSEKQLAAKLLGTTPTEYGFMSTATAKGQGFGGDIILNLYCPRGTKMIYAEPFSAYGGHDWGKNWDGIQKQSYISSEAEMILQRNTKFRVTKVEKSGGTWFIDMEVIDQSR